MKIKCKNRVQVAACGNTLIQCSGKVFAQSINISSYELYVLRCRVIWMFLPIMYAYPAKTAE